MCIVGVINISRRASKIVKIKESKKRLNAVKFESRGNLGWAPVQRCGTNCIRTGSWQADGTGVPDCHSESGVSQVYINPPEERARPDMLLHVFYQRQRINCLCYWGIPRTIWTMVGDLILLSFHDLKKRQGRLLQKPFYVLLHLKRLISTTWILHVLLLNFKKRFGH